MNVWTRGATVDADANSCHVFPLFFPSTLNHKTFRPFRSLVLLRMVWQWKYCVDFPPFLFLPFLYLFLLFSHHSSLSVYACFYVVCICWLHLLNLYRYAFQAVKWRWSRRNRLKSDEIRIRKGFYASQYMRCRWMVIWFLLYC